MSIVALKNVWLLREEIVFVFAERYIASSINGRLHKLSSHTGSLDPDRSDLAT